MSEQTTSQQLSRARVARGSAPTVCPDFQLDHSQRAVIERDSRASFAVLGAPGSGRSTALVELVAARLDAGVEPDEILAIAANRRLASALRDRIEHRVRVAARGGTLGRTAASVAMEIIGEARARAGESAPKLLTGSQQDDILADLIAGMLDGDAVEWSGHWPAWFGEETLKLRGFREEMRDLLGAMVEAGVSPDNLRQLALDPNSAPAPGSRHRTLWAGAARLAEQYFDVLDAAYGGRYDSPQALTEAAALLSERDGLGRERRVFDRVRLVVVDDAQELTEPARRLVREFERRGAQVVTFGDPDIATGTFHGGRAELAVNWRDAGEPVPERLELAGVHRHGPVLREVVQRASAGLGSRLAGTQRAAPSLAEDALGELPIAAKSIESSDVDEVGLITGYLRRLHLLEGVPWREMAVITRSGARLPSLARGFDRAAIPTTASTPLPATEDTTVRAIIALGEVAVAGEISGELLTDALRSPLFGLDPLELRRLRRAAYLADLELGGRSGVQVLAETVNAVLRGDRDEVGDGLLEELRTSHGWVGARAMSSLTEVLGRMRARLAAADPIDTVLFEAWRNDRRADEWQRIALGNDAAALTMNRRLDAVVVLFDRAKRFVEREPSASLSSFLVEWQRDSVVDDSLAQPIGRDAVTLTTPAGAIGREWRVVVVAGVNEGAWPNLRVRDTLLGSGRLTETDAEQSVIDRRAAVLDDETRMLVAAVSRASAHLLVTAVDSQEVQPSQYLRRLQLPELPAVFSLENALDYGYGTLSLEGIAGVLRRELVHPVADDAPGTGPRHALARLAKAGIPGAHPDSWYGVRGRSTTAPLVPVAEGKLELRLSPSGIGTFTDCGVQWFIDRHAGSAPSDNMTIGNILHLAAERVAEFADRAAMMDFAERLLREMNFDAPWIEEVQARTVREAAESLWSYLNRDGRRALANEATIKFGLGRELDDGTRVDVTVAGRIDLIEALDEGCRIIDIKTGTTKNTGAEIVVNPQLRAYQLAHRSGAVAEARDLPLEGAALLYPRIPNSKQLYTLQPQPILADGEVAAVEEDFIDAALAQAGYPLAGSRPGLDRPPHYFAAPDTHCLSSSNGRSSAPTCRIHAIAEVTE